MVAKSGLPFGPKTCKILWIEELSMVNFTKLWDFVSMEMEVSLNKVPFKVECWLQAYYLLQMENMTLIFVTLCLS